MTDATVGEVSEAQERSGVELVAEFAGPNAAYYAAKFQRLAQNQSGPADLNWNAALLGPFWGAVRANWITFWIGLTFDTCAIMLLARGLFAEEGVPVGNSILIGLVVLAAGRLALGWSADRLYRRQFNMWRIDRKVPHGLDTGRLLPACTLWLAGVPLLAYKATQVVPTFRECKRMWRRMDRGEEATFADQFNCWFITDLPIQQKLVHDPIAGGVDGTIDWLVRNFEWMFDAITAGIRWLLQSLELVFVGMPWPVMLVLLILVAWRAAGRNVAVFVAFALGYLAVLGYWPKAMSTLSLVGAATVICIVMGIPIGIWCAKSPRAYAVIRPILDIMQTLPSFVYLIPAIAFFSVGKPPAIVATVIFALPPMVRLTALGIAHVPDSVKEAALAFGATPRQLLWKVELPLAVPSIMTGINQTIMMSLSMVVIAALIAAKGLGEDVLFALQHVEHGKGLLAGGAIALIAMMMDRVVQGTRKRPE